MMKKVFAGPMGLIRENSRYDARSRVAERAAAVAAVMLLAGCTTGSLTSSKSQGTTSSGGVPFGDRISALFNGGNSQAAASQAPVTPTSDDFDCPRIDIRQGASTLLVNAGAGEPNALGLRYQGTFVRAARECRVSGSNVNIKIGVEGRVILGPAGVPGQVTIPLRYALVSETLSESKPIWSKLYLIPVTIPQQTASVSFTNISDDLTVPVPRPAELENWVVYIGFDPNGAQQEQKRKPARGTRPRQVTVE